MTFHSDAGASTTAETSMMTTVDLPLFVAAQRDAAIRRVSDHAGPTFKAQAMRYVVGHLKIHGEASGEDITDACKAAGIVPHDDRAFGSVFQSLVRDGLIECAGFCLRKKGHGTAGGRIWRVKS